MNYNYKGKVWSYRLSKYSYYINGDENLWTFRYWYYILTQYLIIYHLTINDIPLFVKCSLKSIQTFVLDCIQYKAPPCYSRVGIVKNVLFDTYSMWWSFLSYHFQVFGCACSKEGPIRSFWRSPDRWSSTPIQFQMCCTSYVVQVQQNKLASLGEKEEIKRKWLKWSWSYLTFLITRLQWNNSKIIKPTSRHLLVISSLKWT